MLSAAHEPLHAQNDETNGNIEFLQQYPVVAAGVLLEIGTAVTSALLLLDKQLSQTKVSFPVPQNIVTSRCIVVLFGTSCQDTYC
jgi:hypothetical protein